MDTHKLYIKSSSAEPIYRQIAEQIRRLVAAGQVVPGELLPSVREVAALHAINPMTVSRAYNQLESEGILQRLRGKGMAVATQPLGNGSLEQRLHALNPLLEDVARQCSELDIPAEVVLEQLNALLKGANNE